MNIVLKLIFGAMIMTALAWVEVWVIDYYYPWHSPEFIDYGNRNIVLLDDFNLQDGQKVTSPVVKWFYHHPNGVYGLVAIPLTSTAMAVIVWLSPSFRRQLRFGKANGTG